MEIWLIVVFIDTLLVGGQQHKMIQVPRQKEEQCIFSSGDCQYSIELRESCGDSSLDASGNGRQQHYSNMQSDRNRIHGIERSLVDVRSEHSKMISKLENRIIELSDKYVTLPQYKKLDSTIEASKIQLATSESNKANLPLQPKRHEASLLKELHLQFNRLRKDLYGTRRKLKETQKSLKLSKKNHSDTQGILHGTTLYLNKTLIRLEKSKLEVTKANEKVKHIKHDNAELVKKLKSRGNVITSLNSELGDCNEKIHLKEKIIAGLKSNVADSKVEIKRHQAQIAEMGIMLENERINYFLLNDRYVNATQELNFTQMELINCTRGMSF